MRSGPALDRVIGLPPAPAGRPEMVHLLPSGIRATARWEGPSLVVPGDHDPRALLCVELPEPPEPEPDDPDRVAALVTLAATGVVVSAPGDLPGGLDPALAGILRSPLPGDDDALAWEARSVAQRTRAGWAAVRAAGTVVPRLSVQLTTRRPERVGPAVASVARSDLPGLELVLVLHGSGFEPAVVDAAVDAFVASGSGRTATVVAVPADAIFGEALQRGSEAATGPLLAKVDDDDDYGPDHLADLVLAHLLTGAEVVGKGPSFVLLEQLGTTVWDAAFPPERWSTAVAGGTLLLPLAWLHEVGGWAGVPDGVDTALLEATAEHGGRVYRTHPFGFRLTRRATGHTWRTPVGRFLGHARAQWVRTPHELLDPTASPGR